MCDFGREVIYHFSYRVYEILLVFQFPFHPPLLKMRRIRAKKLGALTCLKTFVAEKASLLPWRENIRKLGEYILRSSNVKLEKKMVANLY